jgi:hypothetical protein
MLLSRGACQRIQTILLVPAPASSTVADEENNDQGCVKTTRNGSLATWQTSPICCNNVRCKHRMPKKRSWVRAPGLRDELNWVMVSSAKTLVLLTPHFSGSTGVLVTLHYSPAPWE